MGEHEEKKTTVTPLSIASLGPLNVLVFRKDTKHEGGVSSELLVNVKRNAVKPGDEPGAIPIIEIPALIMLLEAVAEPAMSVRPIGPVQPPTGPQGKLDPSKLPPNRKTRRKAGKK